MIESIRLNSTSVKLSRGRRKFRTYGAATALLLLPSLYFFGWSPVTNQIHTYNTAVPTLYSNILVDNVPSGYLVWNPFCHIPIINPFADDAMHIYKQEKYTACSSNRMVDIREDINGNGVLYMNTSWLDKPLSQYNISCCYSNVSRPENSKDADAKVIKSKCIPFNDSVTLASTEEFTVTKCEVRSKKGTRKTYEDAHANIQISDYIKQRMKTTGGNSTTKPWNVLIFGIDTLSRINLARAMPKTNVFLKNNNWLDFQGYNKMDDNTYPNLMAILTGRNQTRARKMCDQKNNHTLDNCDFIWKKYQNNGYVTAYGEDYFGISTFGQPLHSGFVAPPTDHYLRPLFIAAEKRVKKTRGQLFCTGQTTSGEALFDYALKFTNKYQNHPFFGFFWTNTYSHDDISSPSSMDNKVLEFLNRLKNSQAINTTIIIFMSDHGVRYGDIRSLLVGYYEERLPAFFVWLPSTFKESHPNAYNNMAVNTRRLTTPYDVFMTLEDLLRLSDKIEVVSQSEGCPLCRSLFETVPWNRSCEDASISPHWCTCTPLRSVSVKEDMVKRAIKYVIDVEIESALNTVNTESCRICAKLKIDKVMHAYTYESLTSNSTEYRDYLVVFSTKPGSMVFESTVRHYEDGGDRFQVEGIVSRLTMYRGKGGCVKTAYLKKYCHCTSTKC